MRSLLILIVPLLAGGMAMAYEEPAYEVLESHEDFEIRRYESYVVAEIVVEAAFTEAGNQAFRPLFRYISGNNTRSEKVEMTTPVISRGKSDGEKIEMTIPVVTTMPEEPTREARSYAYYFVLPERFSVASAPRPNDERIVIREVPARVVAARRYTGRSNESNFRKHRARLLDALARNGIDLAGEPEFAVYNGPFTPFFLRRNEVLVELKGS